MVALGDCEVQLRRPKAALVPLLELFADDPTRGEEFVVEVGDLYIDYSKHRITRHTLELLVALVHHSGVEHLRDAMFAGEHINLTEDRAVLHTDEALLPRRRAARPAR